MSTFSDMEIKRPPSKQPIPPKAKRVFKGVIFDVYQWKQKMFDGSTKIFEKIKRADSVNVFPVVDGKIILTEQKQPGSAPFVGAAGGRIDEGETPLEVAKRELLEETGLKAKDYVLWDAVQPVGKIDWAVYSFIAKGCRKVSNLKLDSGEKIKLKSFTFEEFIDLMSKDNYRDTEVALKVLRMKDDPLKLEELRKILME